MTKAAGPDGVDGITTTLTELNKRYGWEAVNKQYIKLLRMVRKDIDTTRPTPVDKIIYNDFTNQCRSNYREIQAVLNDLMRLYLKKGEKLFNS